MSKKEEMDDAVISTIGTEVVEVLKKNWEDIKNCATELLGNAVTLPCSIKIDLSGAKVQTKTTIHWSIKHSDSSEHEIEDPDQVPMTPILEEAEAETKEIKKRGRPKKSVAGSL